VVQIAGRAGEHDLAVGLQLDPSRALLRVAPEWLADQATVPEARVQTPASVETDHGDVASDPPADEDLPVRLDCYAARGVGAAERAEGAATMPERRIE
jgi:hypothetical protein